MTKCIALIYNINKEIQNFANKEKYQEALSLIRFTFLLLSNLLKDLNSIDETKNHGFHHHAFSDILYFYAFTHTYFRLNEYPPTTSDPVIVRNCDVANVETYTNES